MLSNTERGNLLYKERDKIYKKNIIFGKIMFYFFIILPIFLTILYIILTSRLTIILIPIWIISYIVSFIAISSKAFAKKLMIYDNGFVPSLTPLKIRFKKEELFIKYSDIDMVTLVIPKADTTKVDIIGVKNKDGTIVGAEKGFSDEVTLLQLANILREKVPDKVKEDIRR